MSFNTHNQISPKSPDQSGENRPEGSRPEGKRSGRSRSGGSRSARIASASGGLGESRPIFKRTIKPLEIVDEKGLEKIEAKADEILETIGMEFRDDPEILEILAANGGKVDGERVRFSPGMCREIIAATAPSSFIQHARNPEKSVIIGGDHSVLCPSWGPPFVHDLEKGRRYGSYEDFVNLVKLHQMIPYLHHSGGVVCEPIDLPANKRHLDMLYAHIRYSDRPYMGAFIGAERATHSIEMASLVFGAENLKHNPSLYCVSNTNAPLVLDSHMLGALKTYARAGQPVAATPWTLAGAMSLCTVAGTMAQVLAETMAGLALIQMINPGAPCLMGSFASTMSMQSGAPTFGTPEAAKMVLLSGQLARRLGVPLHTVGTLSAAKLPDAQSAQEATMGLMMALFAGANVINHATGWLEGGLVTSFEKTIIDADLCGKMISFFGGVNLDDDQFAIDTIAEVGPGAHFLACAHTQDNFRDAFYAPITADSSSFEQWVVDGEKDSALRSHKIWKDVLGSWEDPGIDPALDAELKAYIAERKAAVPDQNYF